MAPAAVVDDVPNGTSGEKDKTPIVLINGQSDAKDAKKDGRKPNGEQASNSSDANGVEADGVKTPTSTVTDKSSKDSEDTTAEDDTMKCEIKHLDRRYDAKDEAYFAERKDDVEKPKQKDWWRLFAFCVVKHYDIDDELDTTRLYINPQSLRQLLKDVIGNYPTDPIDVDDVQIEAPYHCLFHYRRELESQGLERFKDDEEALAQLKLLLDWIKQHFAEEITAYERCMTSDVKAIAYDRLWTLFPPGTIVYCKVLMQQRAFRVVDTWYDYSDIPGMSTKVQFVDFDGDRLGTRNMELFLPKYTGTRELSELDTMPIDLHEDAEELRKELVERGRKFEGYIGQNYLQYDGIAIKKSQQGYARFNVTGRVMIDCKTYHRLDADDAFHCKEFTYDEAARRRKARRKAARNDFESETQEFDKLSDEDASLTNATVRGYSFTLKRFLEFFVDKLSPIEWNTKCFDSLVLDASTKKTVQALVSTYSKKRDNSFDDIVKGKGQGLVCVLHGPPGVGKTLTAECVAEYVRRPLYMVSSGDLGISSGDLDRQLTRIMDMTSTWQAVLLIDEADVFLEKRSLHDIHRNAMVSVFLRVLEYYAGILFLTTNRVTTFDDAFKSRIHIPIRYTDLSISSRMKIWRNFCDMVPGGVSIDEVGLTILAQHELNGRQIKNVVKAAESLAAFDGVKLDLDQLQQVTKIQALFDKDMNNLSGVDYTAPGEARKDADSRNMFL